MSATPDQAANDTPATTKDIRVILLRHGEREDETEDYDKRQHTRQERIDPALTAFGHRQALHAWEKILDSLPQDKPIFVASSPLRRCMGTALMVAAAAESQKSPLEFVLSSDTNSSQSNSTIPILVMNGLGDCAAQMEAMGGIGKVVKGGWLQCGASPANDWKTQRNGWNSGKKPAPAEVTPLQGCLQSMCATAATVQVNEANKKKKQTNNTANASMDCFLNGIEINEQSKDEELGQKQAASEKDLEKPINNPHRKLQFWRESKYHNYRQLPPEDVSPMTQAQTLKGHAAANSTPPAMSDPPKPMPKNAPSVNEACNQALARAVRLTYHAGLETCVLVTHREAIRYIEDHWVAAPTGSRRQRRLSSSTRATSMYCCVGIYKVTVDTTEGNILRWQNQGVVPYQLLQPSTMEL